VGLSWSALAAVGTQEARLQHLRERIDRLQRELNVAVGKRDSVRDELQTQERRINMLTESLRQIDDQLDHQARTLSGLKDREQRERAAQRAQIHALETQIRAAYSMGRQPYLKVVLNQENPAAASRALVYYRYFNEARAAHIDAAEATLTRLQGLKAEIAEHTSKLIDLRATQERDRQALEASRRQRADLLAALNRQVANQSEEIDRLRADEQRLERLVRELKTVLPEVDVPFPAGKERFAALKGRLPLPLAGRIIAHYGQPKGVGKLTWRGIFVAAKEGQPVRAISRGRVAYADWLRGFGLLLILDHGDGYMTLYGHNEALRRRTGDWVEAGQVIATAGNTGDAPATGVYFEIRKNGVPNDPLQWCATGRTNPGRARR
jgi:murein hydrolase activator